MHIIFNYLGAHHGLRALDDLNRVFQFLNFLHIAEDWVGPMNIWKKVHTGDADFSREKIEQVNAEILLVKPFRQDIGGYPEDA